MSMPSVASRAVCNRTTEREESVSSNTQRDGAKACLLLDEIEAGVGQDATQVLLGQPGQLHADRQTTLRQPNPEATFTKHNFDSQTCSSGSRSDGLLLWNAPAPMNKMWSVLTGPRFCQDQTSERSPTCFKRVNSRC